MGGAMLVAAQLHLGASIIIAGFTAIFFTLGVGGGVHCEPICEGWRGTAR